MFGLTRITAVTSAYWLALSLFFSAAEPSQAAGIHIFAKKKEVMQGKKLTARESTLIDKAIVRERETVKIIRERAPIVETYIQNMKPDSVTQQITASDQHFLGRVDFKKIINDDPFKAGPKPEDKTSKLDHLKISGNFFHGLNRALHLEFQEAGFVQMLLVDSSAFDRQHYNFYFVRNDFLGNTPTSVFDVVPTSNKNHKGRFFGRIWVETRAGNIVRFNGDFTGSEKSLREFYHFDSWRTNVQPDLWLPTSFYVEESDPNSRSHTLKFKAISHVWGYLLKVPSAETENTSMEVVGAQDVSNDAQDVSPLGAQRTFNRQAEDNVIERLYEAGLIDAPGEFDKTLEALASNILAYNNITVSSPIRVRILLTEPLESLAVGNTIILSKGLIDTSAVITQDGAQQAGNLNAILAFQVAHIIAGHRLDTKFAFNDRLLFPDNASFQRIPMRHSDAENVEAAKKAIELLNAKELVDGQKYFGLYLAQLQQREKGLASLNQPTIGDSLMKSGKDPSFWMAALLPKADKLDIKDLKQQAAEPLSSFLRFDPWTDQLLTMRSSFEPLLSAADKMPFEVSPVSIKLSYYRPPVPPSNTIQADPSVQAAQGEALPPAGTPGSVQAQKQPAPGSASTDTSAPAVPHN